MAKYQCPEKINAMWSRSSFLKNGLMSLQNNCHHLFPRRWCTPFVPFGRSHITLPHLRNQCISSQPCSSILSYMSLPSSTSASFIGQETRAPNGQLLVDRHFCWISMHVIAWRRNARGTFALIPKASSSRFLPTVRAYPTASGK